MQKIIDFINEKLKVNSKTKINNYPIYSFLSKYDFKYDKIDFGKYYYKFNQFKKYPEIQKSISIQRFFKNCEQEINKNILGNKLVMKLNSLTTNIGRKRYDGIDINFEDDNKPVCQIELIKQDEFIILSIKKSSYDEKYEDLYIDSLEYLFEYSNKIKF